MLRLLALGLLLWSTPVFALDCADGSIKCGAVCSPVCNTSGFTGMCVGSMSQAQTQVNPTGCIYTRCGVKGNTGGDTSPPICVSGPMGTQGCNTDAQCKSTEVCVSTNGNIGCGSGFAQCFVACPTTTSTSTTSTTSTSTSSTTTTSTSSTTTTSTSTTSTSAVTTTSSSTTTTTIVQVTIHFGVQQNCFSGKVHVNDGSSDNTYTFDGTGDCSVQVLQDSTVNDGTVVSITVFEPDDSTPYCQDPGQAFSASWNNVFTDTLCISGFRYKRQITIDSGEATDGIFRFNPFT